MQEQSTGNLLTGFQRGETAPFSILHTEWSNGWGGQGHRIILECIKVMALGHKVVIAAQPDSPLYNKALQSGIPVEPVRIRGNFDLLAIRDLCRLIRKHRITVVNTHSSRDTWVASLAAKLSGVPLLIRTRHISTPISTNPFNFVHHLADGISTTGEMIREELIKVNRMSPGRVMSIPSGVSLERFDLSKGDGSKVRREFDIPDHSPLVVMVAVFRGMKRHDLLIAAVGLLRGKFPEMKVLLAGKGTDSEAMKHLIAEAGLQDTIIAAGNRDDIPDVLAAADIVVLTSDKDEGVPQSLTQAMVMERPVVAAPVGGIPELVLDGETGLLAATGDAGSFAVNIERLLEDDGLRKRLGTAARQHVLGNYTDDIMAEKTIAFYQRLFTRKTDTPQQKQARVSD